MRTSTAGILWIVPCVAPCICRNTIQPDGTKVVDNQGNIYQKGIPVVDSEALVVYSEALVVYSEGLVVYSVAPVVYSAGLVAYSETLVAY